MRQRAEQRLGSGSGQSRCETVADGTQRHGARPQATLADREPVLGQVLREQQTGYALLRADGSIVECDEQATALAGQMVFASPGQSNVFVRLVQEISASPGIGSPYSFRLPLTGRHRVVEVNAHRIDGASWGRGTEFLILLRPLGLGSVRSGATSEGELDRLPPRQREVALLLATTGMTYQDVADSLGVAVGTIRKHAECAYRRLGVHCRSELTALVLSVALSH